MSRRWCGWLLGAALWAAPSSAWALGWAAQNPPVYISDNHVGVNDIVSRADCLHDSVEVVFKLNGFTVGNSIQVWGTDNASTDCSTSAAQTNNECVQLFTKALAGTVVEVPLTPKDIVRAALKANSTTCTGVNDTPVSLQFIEYQGGGSSVVGTVTHALRVDLEGPRVPTLSVIASGGAGRLTLRATPASDDSDIKGLEAYCVLSSTGGTTGSGGMGTGGMGAGGMGTGGMGTGGMGTGGTGTGGMGTGGMGTGGTGTGGTANGGSFGACGSPAAGVSADTLTPNGAEPSTTEVTAEGLSHREYACAVAGVDNVNNPSTLSNVVCGTPEALTGPPLPEGCFCTAPGQSHGKGPFRDAGVLAVFGLLGAWWLRRRGEKEKH